MLHYESFYGVHRCCNMILYTQLISKRVLIKTKETIMVTNYSACYRVSGSNSFTSEYFSDEKSATSLACEMSKRTPGYMAYVHKNVGDWINGVFYESKTTTVAIYVNGKQR